MAILKKLLIVEDDQALRQTIKSVLSDLPVEQVEASNGIEALKLIERQSFHVILTDIKMPGMDGIEFVATLKEKKINSPVIFYSAFPDKEMLMKLIKIGAFDFIEKPFEAERIIKAVEDALLYSDQNITTKLQDLGLKARDTEILKLVFKGLANKEIATIVNLSEHCVKYHLGNLLEKFEATNRIELRNKVQSLIEKK